MILDSVSEMESSGDVKGLIEMLEDSDPQIRFNSAQSLGSVGGCQLDLLHQALNSENLYLRWGAAYALGGVKDPKSVPYLIEALKKNYHELNGRITRWIIYAIGEIGGEEVLDALLELIDKKIEYNNDLWTQEYAVRVLGFIGGKKALKMLKNRIDHDWKGYAWLYADGKWAIGIIEDELQDKKMETDPNIEFASSNFKSLKLSPAESHLLKSYKVRDKDDIGEFMMIYTLYDLILRGVLITEQHINLKTKKRFLRESYTFLQEFCIIKHGENLKNTELKPHEKKIVSYVKKDRGIELSKFSSIADNDKIGAKFRNDYVKYLAGEGYFNSGVSRFVGTKLTDKGKEALELLGDALDEGNNIRIWLENDPGLAFQYINNMAGNILLKRHCTTTGNDIPVVSRKIFEAKNHQELLYCYYWLIEGPKTDLN